MSETWRLSMEELASVGLSRNSHLLLLLLALLVFSVRSQGWLYGERKIRTPPGITFSLPVTPPKIGG